MCLFYKIQRNKFPSYLFRAIPTSRLHVTRNLNNLEVIISKYNFFNNSLFPSVISELDKFNMNIRDSAILESSKKQMLNFIRTRQNSTFKLHNLIGIKLLTRLRVALTHLKEHKLKHNLRHSIGPWCSCGNSIESNLLSPLRKLYISKIDSFV